MKKCNIIILYLMLVIPCSYGQEGNTLSFQNQKHRMDSIILKEEKLNFQSRSIAGADSILHTYKGSVSINDSNDIKKIVLNFDSSSLKVVLFCIHNKIFAISENGHFFYKINNDSFNSKGIKETSQQVLNRFKSYDEIMKTVSILFKAT